MVYRGATPMKPKGSMWSCPGRAACQSRSWPCQETVTQVFIRAPRSTGAPNKARGRSAYPASELRPLMVKGR